MRLKPAVAWYLAFTAAFAALAGLVFWGTWSLDVVPVMPDAQTAYPADFAWRQWRFVLESGKLIPSDIRFFFGSPYFWQELQYVLAVYAAALGIVYFGLGRGLSRLAAYGSGLLLAFCGYWLTLYSAGHVGWFLWMTYGVFAFGLVDRAVRLNRSRHWLLLGLTVAWAGFNQQDLWLLFTLFTAAYFLWCCWRERRFPWRGMLLSAGVFVLVGMPNFIDTIEHTLAGRKEQIQQFEKGTGAVEGESTKDARWEFVTNWSMPVEDTCEFFAARIHGDTSCPFVQSIGMKNANGIRPYTGALGRPMRAAQGNYRQHSLYVGWVTCLLALVGVVFGFRRPDVKFFLGAAIVCYALSLGRNFEPAYRLIYALPAGDLIRCPVKWHHLTEFALVVLAAYGIESLWQWRRLSPWWGRVLVIALVAWGALDLAIEAHRYCAPVSMREVRRQGMHADMTILSRNDFNRPEIAEMVRRRQLVSVANYLGNPNYYVVQVLKRFDPRPVQPLKPLNLALGLISVLTALAVIGFSIRQLRGRDTGDGGQG